jgi:hypothetical protein
MEKVIRYEFDPRGYKSMESAVSKIIGNFRIQSGIVDENIFVDFQMKRIPNDAHLYYIEFSYYE